MAQFNDAHMRLILGHEYEITSSVFEIWDSITHPFLYFKGSLAK